MDVIYVNTSPWFIASVKILCFNCIRLMETPSFLNSFLIDIYKNITKVLWKSVMETQLVRTKRTAWRIVENLYLYYRIQFKVDKSPRNQTHDLGIACTMLFCLSCIITCNIHVKFYVPPQRIKWVWRFWKVTTRDGREHRIKEERIG